jgi:hypothetical protein
MEKGSTQAEQVKLLRRLTSLTAEVFCNKSGISLSSFKKWEAGVNPLSINSAHKLVTAAAQSGIVCNAFWLLNGKGAEAKLSNEISEEDKLKTEDFSNHSGLLMTKEIESITNIYPKAEVLIVTDDSMLPQFCVGDYVCGLPVTIEEKEKFLDFPCVVETKDKRKRLRRIGYSKGSFFLWGTNTSYKEGPIFEPNPLIEKISPIFWHRIVNNQNSSRISKQKK